MQKPLREYEARVLGISPKAVRTKLQAIGAKLEFRGTLKRTVYQISKDYWVRLRDEGKKTTLALKRVSKRSIESEETEIIVGNFEETRHILSIIGIKEKAYQENRRESYSLSGIRFDIDTWPTAPPYLEIEGKSPSEVSKGLALLGIPLSKATTLHGSYILRNAGLDVDKHEFVSFRKLVTNSGKETPLKGGKRTQ